MTAGIDEAPAPAWYDADGALRCPSCRAMVYQFDEGETCSRCDWAHDPAAEASS